MERKLLFLGLMIVAVILIYGQDFYDIETINDLEITFAESNWDSILDSYYSQGDEERLTGTAVINGVEYDSVGVRYKGNSTYSSNRVKNPLNIKLDHVIDDQTLDGYGTLKLANVWNDPSFVRETLSYEIARKYMAASGANYIRVTINGQYLGLYTNVQSVDKYFMETYYGNRDNPFFKGELTNDNPQNDAVIWGYLGDNQSVYEDYYELKSDEGWEDLINFLDVFNNNSSQMNTVLNVDAHLWMLAFDNLLVNLDSPINFGHNYYLYETVNGFNPIIWDLNESFGVFSMLLNGGSGPGGGLSFTDMQQLDPYLNENDSDYPIIGQVLENDIYKQRYVAHMKTMIEENFSNGWYETRGEEIQAIIDAEVQADPNKFYSYTYFQQNLNSSVGSGPQQTIGITQLMDSRSSYLLSLSDFVAEQPEIGEMSTEPETPQSGQTALFTVPVAEVEEVYIVWKTNTVGQFTETELFDDGSGGDEYAGDGIFSAQIEASGSEMSYYIVADNSSASAFSPARASWELYTIELEYTPQEGIVINEFMADNDNIVMDEAGEYDDWLELYNYSGTSLDIGGWYLSDDLENITKWEIPEGTVIENDDYLCFWADEDQEQGDLHTNFKLSASGESVILSDSMGNIIDEISYPQQSTDISYGRYPDGEGEFDFMTPSFEQSNYDGITGAAEDNITGITGVSNYPNPFNPVTTISFSLKEGAYTELNIYDIRGRFVQNLASADLAAGSYQYIWDGKEQTGSQAASGLYFYRLKSGETVVSGKMVMMK